MRTLLLKTGDARLHLQSYKWEDSLLHILEVVNCRRADATCRESQELHTIGLSFPAYCDYIDPRNQLHTPLPQ